MGSGEDDAMRNLSNDNDTFDAEPPMVADYNWFEFDRIVNSYIVPAVVVVGMIGNSLIIHVLMRSGMWHSIRPYLVVLAVWDLLLLVFAWIIFSLISWHWHGIISPISYDAMSFFPVAYMLANLCFKGHLWTTIALTFERYLALVHTMWHRRFMHRTLLMTASLLLALLIGLAFGVPRYFEVQIDVRNPSTSTDDEPELEVNPTALFHNPIYQKFFRIAGSLVFGSVGPFLLLTGLTARMLLAVHGHTGDRTRDILATSFRFHDQLTVPRLQVVRTRSKATSGAISPKVRRRYAEKANRPLLIVMVLSVLCYMLPTAADILQFSTSGENAAISWLLNYVVVISNVLVLINASIPFYVYTLSSKRFRSESLRLLWVSKVPHDELFYDQGSPFVSPNVFRKTTKTSFVHQTKAASALKAAEV